MNPTDLITTYPRPAGAIAGVLVLCVCWGAIALWRRLGRKRGGPLPWRNEMFCGGHVAAADVPFAERWLVSHTPESRAFFSPEAMAERAKLFADEPDDDEPAPYGSKPDESKRPVTYGEFWPVHRDVIQQGSLIWCLEKRVEAEHENLLSLENNGNDALFKLHERIAALEARLPFANPECDVRAWAATDPTMARLWAESIMWCRINGVWKEDCASHTVPYIASLFTELPRAEALALYREWLASKGDV